VGRRGPTFSFYYLPLLYKDFIYLYQEVYRVHIFTLGGVLLFFDPGVTCVGYRIVNWGVCGVVGGSGGVLGTD